MGWLVGGLVGWLVGWLGGLDDGMGGVHDEMRWDGIFGEREGEAEEREKQKRRERKKQIDLGRKEWSGWGGGGESPKKPPLTTNLPQTHPSTETRK